jgi:hypothetical protein
MKDGEEMEVPHVKGTEGHTHQRGRNKRPKLGEPRTGFKQGSFNAQPSD